MYVLLSNAILSVYIYYIALIENDRQDLNLYDNM